MSESASLTNQDVWQLGVWQVTGKDLDLLRAGVEPGLLAIRINNGQWYNIIVILYRKGHSPLLLELDQK